MTPMQMEESIATADIVITHGGPATIALARSAGRLPIVVPRLRRYGEHVDDHQLWYARRLAEAQEVILVEEVRDLPSVIEHWAELAGHLPSPEPLDISLAVARFADLANRVAGSDGDGLSDL